MTNNPLSLNELNNQIKLTLNSKFSNPLWIIAEISEIKVNANGHCYLELIEKEKDENIVAIAKAIIWAYTFRILKPYFESSTGKPLSQGMKIMVNALVEFHEVYGYSLNIRDIEPSFTIGELEKQKQLAINRLQEEGVINMNKEFELPSVIQNIAVVSSKTAAGYEDFINQLDNNSFRYKFNYQLFPAIMQGNEAIESIIKALEKINSENKLYDATIIIRGGGSHADLSCFDDYWLAFNVAQFPIPVFTGIGHEKDDSVIDIVAHTRLKTPTAVAEFIINHNYLFETYLFELESQISNESKNILTEYKNDLNNLVQDMQSKIIYRFAKEKGKLNIKNEKIKLGTKNRISYFHSSLENKTQQINYSASNYLGIQNLLISNYMQSIRLLDPHNIIERGYSLTYKNNEIIKDIKQVKPQDMITTRIKKGKIKSIITHLE